MSRGHVPVAIRVPELREDVVKSWGAGRRRRGPSLKAKRLARGVTADTITDEQIMKLWRDHPNSITGRLLMEALGENRGPGFRKLTADETRTARARCAEIFNARSTK